MSDYEAEMTLLDDMAAAIHGLRGYFMQIAEEHPGMDTGALDDLLRRYRDIKGHGAPRVDPNV